MLGSGWGVEMSDFRSRVRNSAYSNVSVHDEDEMDRMADDYPSPPSDDQLLPPPATAGPHPFAGCCFVFSIIAMVFLVVVGIIFQGDPVYIKNPVEGLSRKKAGGNCFGAAGCYFVTAVISAGYYYKGKKKIQGGARTYRTLDD